MGCRLFPADRHHDSAERLRDAAGRVRRHLHRRAGRPARSRQPARPRHPARHALRARSLRQLPAGEAARRAAVPLEGPVGLRRELRRVPREHGRALRRHRRPVQGGHRGRNRDSGRAEHLQGRAPDREARVRVRGRERPPQRVHGGQEQRDDPGPRPVAAGLQGGGAAVSRDRAAAPVHRRPRRC